MPKAKGAAAGGGRPPEGGALAVTAPPFDHGPPPAVPAPLPPFPPSPTYSMSPHIDYSLPATGRIFLGRVRSDVNRASLMRALTPFGRVIDCRLVSTLRSGRPKRFAFVDLECPAAAAAAIAALHGNVALGDPYLLAAHSTDEVASAAAAAGGSPPWWHPGQQEAWEEEASRFQYAHYMYGLQPQGLRPSAYGLPFPPSAAAAAAAVVADGEALGVPSPPVPMSPGGRLAPLAVPLPPGAAPPPPPPPPPPCAAGPVTTLYVRGLPVDMDEFGLLNMYAPLGTIYATKILRNLDSYESRGAGFVEFSTLVEAQTALQATNRAHSRDGRVLRVQFAERQLRLSKGAFQAVWPVAPPPPPLPAGAWPPGAMPPPPPPPLGYHHPGMTAQEMAAAQLAGSGRTTPEGAADGGDAPGGFRRAGDPVVVWSTLSADSANGGGAGAQHTQHEQHAQQAFLRHQQRMGYRPPASGPGGDAYAYAAAAAAATTHYAGYSPQPFVPGGGGKPQPRRGARRGGSGNGNGSNGRPVSSQDTEAAGYDSETTVQAAGQPGSRPPLPAALTPRDRPAISSRVAAAAQTMRRANSGGLGGGSVSSVGACNGSVGDSGTSGDSASPGGHARRPGFAEDSLSPPTGRHSACDSGGDSVASCGTGAAGASPGDADDVAQATSRLTLAA